MDTSVGACEGDDGDDDDDDDDVEEEGDPEDVEGGQEEEVGEARRSNSPTMATAANCMNRTPVRTTAVGPTPA
jgi:hypothetical protein